MLLETFILVYKVLLEAVKVNKHWNMFKTMRFGLAWFKLVINKNKLQDRNHKHAFVKKGSKTGTWNIDIMFAFFTFYYSNHLNWPVYAIVNFIAAVVIVVFNVINVINSVSVVEKTTTLHSLITNSMKCCRVELWAQDSQQSRIFEGCRAAKPSLSFIIFVQRSLCRLWAFKL